MTALGRVNLLGTTNNQVRIELVQPHAGPDTPRLVTPIADKYVEELARGLTLPLLRQSNLTVSASDQGVWSLDVHFGAEDNYQVVVTRWDFNEMQAVWVNTQQLLDLTVSAVKAVRTGNTYIAPVATAEQTVALWIAGGTAVLELQPRGVLKPEHLVFAEYQVPGFRDALSTIAAGASGYIVEGTHGGVILERTPDQEYVTLQLTTLTDVRQSDRRAVISNDQFLQLLTSLNSYLG